jgi:nucleotide-binding universal stress UspA family protein
MKALWAYEPFHQDQKRISGMHRLLRQLVGSPSNIEAGFIVTRTETNLNLAFDVPDHERFSLYPRKLIKESLKKSKVSIDNKRIHVVDYETLSNTKAVDRMLAVAKSRKAGLIALYTQSRAGFRRFVLGSFAETMIHRSSTDLLLANPKVEFSKNIKKVFFLSDFTPASKKHLTHVVQLCRRLKAQLVVFHAAEAVYKWSLDENNAKIKAYRRKVEKTKTEIEKECQRASVKCDVVITSDMWSTSDIAIRTADKMNVDLLVVAAKSSPMAALMGGSITRQLVRASSKPVLVLKRG